MMIVLVVELGFDLRVFVEEDGMFVGFVVMVVGDYCDFEVVCVFVVDVDVVIFDYEYVL